ncbi:baculoviral IAP repeat-containing protein 7-A isoform X2 [Cimex lectularius]|nr:baculoviral IAP repeat-containing protein 7-A isoform X2 [Cimex lectularius]XP_024086282.1 baculoviral IAP repeat-containing protein 7-A isoform X2 [Cimex lectularius]XP_024086283.1 baculoviral IAP repeat-containing protein 7-A isoform X2 [Cimex lectularius]XP_024086287.1 baculoviral IAP repeat-containing protein 7-A isoform X2 [Cimex lectularius]
MPPTTNGTVNKPLNMAQKTTTVTDNSVRFPATVEEDGPLPSTSWSIPLSESMRHEAERLKTFEQWPVTFITPRAMTSAGFYYLKREDLVKCAFCGVEVGRWVPGDDPMADHKKWSPGCRFVKEINVGNVPISEETNMNNIETDRGYDTCGSVEIGLSQDQVTKVNILEKHAGYQKTREPAFPHYAAYSSRLMSYETWPVSLKLKPNVLSDAGFFYTGKSDQTVCYHCGGGLKDWEETDEPWVEHARWFSKCSFVLLVKGKDFVDEVSGNKASQEAKSSNSNDEVGQVSTSTDTEKTLMEEGGIVDTTCIKKTAANNESTNDGRLCKICYMDEMGVLFLPCGHIVACVKCALSLRTCAVCRKPVTATFRAFLS